MSIPRAQATKARRCAGTIPSAHGGGCNRTVQGLNLAPPALGLRARGAAGGSRTRIDRLFRSPALPVSYSRTWRSKDESNVSPEGVDRVATGGAPTHPSCSVEEAGGVEPLTRRSPSFRGWCRTTATSSSDSRNAEVSIPLPSRAPSVFKAVSAAGPIRVPREERGGLDPQRLKDVARASNAARAPARFSLHFVGATGVEPVSSCPPDRCLGR